MKTFGLLGEKLGHSFSPMIHGFLGDYTYLLYEVAPGDLDSFMTTKQFDGINVTIPYKQSVMPYCDFISEEARMIGSVNTIVKGEDRKLRGYNTDFHGFRVMLEQSGIDPNGKKALVLGDGGAARTVRAVLDTLGAREIVTISRRGENHYGNIDRHHDADIIINTTPVGMYPENGSSPLSLAGFGRLTGMADLIYNPLRTKLLLDAEEIGVPCVNGLIMLVAQAEMASRLFHMDSGQPTISGRSGILASRLDSEFRIPNSKFDEILDSIVKKIQNIAIIGMPGCGKSTVGHMLAQIMGRPFVNADEKVEAAAGRTIPEIFSGDGEEAFRRLETQILTEETRKSGVVIATGGGVVTRPENFGLLRQNSIIVYLKRELSELVLEGRPLSQSEGIQTLARQRLPLYEAWSDYAVQSEADPERTAAKIHEALKLMQSTDCKGSGNRG